MSTVSGGGSGGGPWPFRSRASASRRRLIVTTALGLEVVILVGTAVRLMIGEITTPALEIVAAVALVLAGVPWLVRRGAVVAAGWLTTGGFFVVVIGVGWASGGLQAPIFLLLPTLPLLANFLVGGRAGWLILTLSLVAVASLTVAGPLEPMDAPWRQSASKDVQVRALMTTLSLLVVGLFTAATRRQERASRAEVRLYEQLFTDSQDVVAVTSPDGRAVAMNQAGLDLYGFASAEDLAAYDLRRLYVDPGERERLSERLVRDGHVREYESRHRTVDGRELVVQGTTSAVRGRRGEVRHWLTILRDVTELRRRQGERQRMIAELEAKNAELERFAFAVSHDLKGPLFTLRGFLELLADDPADIRPLEDAAKMLPVADRMATLLDDLLELARLGHGGARREEVSMVELARQVVDDLGGRLGAGGVEASVSPHLPPATGDPTLIRTLLQNLVENAIKFCGGVSGARIEIDHRLEDGAVVYRVSDNGPGLAPGDRERVFELFTQLDAEAPGSGVGLAVVEKVARLHGGRAWALDREPPGATFCFTLAGNGPTALGAGGRI